MNYQPLRKAEEEEVGSKHDSNNEQTRDIFTPGMSHSHMMNNEFDEVYNKKISQMEDDWFQESSQHFQSLPWYRRPSKSNLFTILAIHTISFTILMGPLVVLMMENICATPDSSDSSSAKPSMTNMKRMDMGGGAPSADPKCLNHNPQKVISNIQTILSIVSGLLGFILSGKYGQWSDKYGRVFVFKIFCIINIINTLLLILYFQINKSFSKSWMILVISTGYLSGGVMTLISNGNSYLNDIIPAQDRTISISLFMSCIYTTVGVGPLLGSFIVKATGGNNGAVLYASLGFGVVSTLLVFGMVLPESRHPEAMRLAKEMYQERDGDSSGYRAHWVDSIYDATVRLFAPIKRLWIPRRDNGSLIPRINVICLVLIDVMSMAATFGTMHVVILYTILKYKWTGVEIGYYMSISGFGRSLVLLVVAPLILKMLQKIGNFPTLKHSIDKIDKFCLILSLTFVVLSSLSLVLLNNSFGVYLSVVLQSLSGMISPTIQSAVVKYSNKTEAGEMFGAMALVRHLAMLIIPSIFLQIYSHTVDSYPKTFMFIPLVGSTMTLLLAVVCLRVYDLEEEEDINDCT